MGLSSSKDTDPIPNYKTFDELSNAMKSSGVLEDLNIMVFFDFTKSNEWTGEKTFYGEHLHALRGNTNRYLDTIGSLKYFMQADLDQNIAVYTYGTRTSAQCAGYVQYHGVCKTVDEMKMWYSSYSQDPVTKGDLYGPTTLQYIMAEAKRVVQITKHYHVVLILTDGCPDEKYTEDDIRSIYDASHHPISVVIVGVGDGEYDTVNRVPTFPFYEGLDDDDEKLMRIKKGTLKKIHSTTPRQFDNVQFINLESEILKGREMDESKQKEFYFKGFMEVPTQYRLIKKQQNYRPGMNTFVHPVPEGWVDPRCLQESNNLPPPVYSNFQHQSSISQAPVQPQYDPNQVPYAHAQAVPSAPVTHESLYK